MGCKATETTHNIINTQAQELLTNVQCSDGLRSFAKETRALKMKSIVAGHQKLTRTKWEQSLKLILLQLCKKLPKNSTLTILQLLGICNKLERSQCSISGCLKSWLQIKKSSFWVSFSLILCNNNEPFLDQIVICNEKWVLYNRQRPAQWLDWE